MLQTCTSSTAGDMLTTGIQPLKDLLGLSTATSEDANLTLMIQAATAQLEQWFDQPISLGTYRETVTGNDDLELMLSRTPIRSVLAVFDATSTSDGTEILSSEYVLEDAEAGILTHPSGWAWTPAKSLHLTESPIRTDLKQYLVEYTAGYRIVESTTTAGGVTSTGRDVPADIELAGLYQAKGLYSGRRRDGGLTKLRVGPTERTWGGVQERGSILFPDAEALITRRKRAVVA